MSHIRVWTKSLFFKIHFICTVKLYNEMSWDRDRQLKCYQMRANDHINQFTDNHCFGESRGQEKTKDRFKHRKKH